MARSKKRTDKIQSAVDAFRPHVISTQMKGGRLRRFIAWGPQDKELRIIVFDHDEDRAWDTAEEIGQGRLGPDVEIQGPLTGSYPKVVGNTKRGKPKKRQVNDDERRRIVSRYNNLD